MSIDYIKSTRLRSFITIENINTENWDIIHKICEILFTDEYSESSKNIARSVLTFTIDNKIMTWSQYDMIYKIKKIGEKVPLKRKFKKK